MLLKCSFWFRVDEKGQRGHGANRGVGTAASGLERRGAASRRAMESRRSGRWATEAGVKDDFRNFASGERQMMVTFTGMVNACRRISLSILISSGFSGKDKQDAEQMVVITECN